MIRLERFTRDTNPPAFRSYLRVKYEVFVEEQGWPLDADRQQKQTREDAVDPKSCFVLATDDAGREVGTVRGTMLSEAFPHREMLQHHLSRSGIELELSHLGTINALAVRPELRGRRLPIAGRDGPLTIGKAVMCEITDWCREQGALALIFTTMRGVPAIFFEHLGSYVVDPWFRIKAIEVELVNMVLLTTDPARFRERTSPLLATCPARPLTSQEQACRDYCLRRNSDILQGRTIEQYVA